MTGFLINLFLLAFTLLTFVGVAYAFSVFMEEVLGIDISKLIKEKLNNKGADKS